MAGKVHTEMVTVTTLYRPVGQRELDLIALSGWRVFPPRLDWQPIFYPVTNELYATRIAAEWNTEDAENGNVGYVLKFDVESEFLAQFEVQQVGDATCLEYWIPSERLTDFNAAIAGSIEQVSFFSKWADLPVVLLDIDGVLNPLGKSAPPGFRTYFLDGFEVALSDRHGAWLQSLVGKAELVWASTWEYTANESVGKMLGLPPLPAVAFGKGRDGDTWKMAAVSEWVGDRPFVWIEDDLFLDAYDWAKERAARSLLVKPSGHVGLTEAAIEQIDEFLAQSGA